MVAISSRRHEHARTVVAALARDGWLHDPAEIERLRLENRRLRINEYGGAPGDVQDAADEFRAVLDGNATPTDRENPHA
jgi:hypothetical protein